MELIFVSMFMPSEKRSFEQFLMGGCLEREQMCSIEEDACVSPLMK